MREKVTIGISYVLSGILALAFVALLITYIVIPNIMYLLLLILDFIFLRKLVSMFVKKNHTALLKRSVSFLIVFVLSTLFWGQFHMPISVTSRWQYPMALKYAYCFQAVSTFFPEELPTSAKDVRYDFFPSILQPDAILYIIYTNYDWNHSRFKAVFIDGNHVFFSEQ